MTLTLRFARSNSPYFPLIQEIASAHPTYCETAAGSQTVYSVSPDPADHELIHRLWVYASGWKSFEVWKDGALLSSTMFGMAMSCAMTPHCRYQREYCDACPKLWSSPDGEEIRRLMQNEAVDMLRRKFIRSVE